jgi:hypothetical protein
MSAKILLADSGASFVTLLAARDAALREFWRSEFRGDECDSATYHEANGELLQFVDKVCAERETERSLRRFWAEQFTVLRDALDRERGQYASAPRPDAFGQMTTRLCGAPVAEYTDGMVERCNMPVWHAGTHGHEMCTAAQRGFPLRLHG